MGHYGLLTIQERAQLIGGKLTIIGKPGKGTVIKGTFPLGEANVDEKDKNSRR